MEKNNPGYYGVITADVRYDSRIRANAKLLYAEITALCNKEGYCWASNAYFSNLYEVSNRVVQVWIKQLIKVGYIRVEIQNLSNRRIFVHGGVNKCSRGGEQMFIHNSISNTKYKTQCSLITKKENQMEYIYETIEGDTPRARRAFKGKVTAEQNKLFMAAGALWANLLIDELGCSAQDIPLKGISIVARKLWERENRQWSYDDFKGLFKYFLNDIKNPADKISFDLCMSEKYVARYKLTKRNTKKTFAGISSEIKL